MKITIQTQERLEKIGVMIIYIPMLIMVLFVPPVCCLLCLDGFFTSNKFVPDGLGYLIFSFVFLIATVSELFLLLSTIPVEISKDDLKKETADVNG